MIKGFNAEIRKKIVKEVESTLLARNDNGTLRDETDFVTGACAVMRIVNMELYGASEEESMDCMPPKWFVWIMSGRSIVEEIKKEK